MARAWTRSQEAALVAAQQRLAAVIARRGNEANMTPAQRAQLRNDLVAAQNAVNTLTRQKNA